MFDELNNAIQQVATEVRSHQSTAEYMRGKGKDKATAYHENRIERLEVVGEFLEKLREKYLRQKSEAEQIDKDDEHLERELRNNPEVKRELEEAERPARNGGIFDAKQPNRNRFR